jgi:hypothetical protein
MIWSECGRREMHTEFGLGNQKERDHLENPGIDAKIILIYFLNK